VLVKIAAMWGNPKGSLFAVSALALLALPGAAAASACANPAPAPGESFSGPVLEVTDGGEFCVAKGPTPQEWIPVRLAVRIPGADRGTLMAASFARRVDCVAERISDGVVIARCFVGGRDLGQLLQSPAMRNEGRGWR